MMRVAIIDTEPDIPGGHQIQVTQTARALTAAGLEVVTVGGDDSWPEVDVAHVFAPDLPLIRRARTARIPVAVTPVYQPEAWSYQLDGQVSGGAALRRRGRVAAWLAREALAERHIAAAHELLATSERRRMVYESADLLLPNSDGEAAEIATELGVTTPMCVVPNGVDTARFSVGSASGRHGVLSVGRFEPHKNQLGLIEAMATVDAPLTMIGAPHPHHSDYLDRCRHALGSDMTILDAVPHDELPDRYAAAEVHVLPSWFETTGLASLEAGASGCTVVTTSRGHATEYFGDDAYYCDPGDPASISAAITSALHTPKPATKDRVLARYDWSAVAAATIAAYRTIVTP